MVREGVRAHALGSDSPAALVVLAEAEVRRGVERLEFGDVARAQRVAREAQERAGGRGALGEGREPVRKREDAKGRGPGCVELSSCWGGGEGDFGASPRET